MKKIVTKLSVVFMSLLILTTMLPMNVEAKTKKTVKIYDFTSGDAQVDAKVRSVIKKKIKPNMTTAQKVKAIHDYMVLNCEYDYDNLLKGTIPLVSYSPRGVLINKKAVCQGYAETFQLFMDALGIPCKFVRGTNKEGEGHGWNMVQINNKWYHIDVTWDDPVPDEKGRLLYGYFLIPDEKMDDDHVWNKAVYPKCTGSSNKFLKLVYKKNVSKTLKQAKNNFYKEYKKNKNHKNKEYTIIVPQKVHKKYPNFDTKLSEYVEEKCAEKAWIWTYSKVQYGDYYIYKMKVLGVDTTVSKNIKNVSKTLEQAKNSFYKQYEKNKNKEATIIVTQKLYKEHPDLIDCLVEYVEEKCSIRVFGRSHSKEQYGKYYVIKIKVLKTKPAEKLPMIFILQKMENSIY